MLQFAIVLKKAKEQLSIKKILIVKYVSKKMNIQLKNQLYYHKTTLF